MKLERRGKEKSVENCAARRKKQEVKKRASQDTCTALWLNHSINVPTHPASEYHAHALRKGKDRKERVGMPILEMR